MSRVPARLRKLIICLLNKLLSNQITFSESPEELIVDCFSDIEELVAKLLSRLRKLSLSLDIGSKLTSLGFPASVEFLELSDCEVFRRLQVSRVSLSTQH